MGEENSLCQNHARKHYTVLGRVPTNDDQTTAGRHRLPCDSSDNTQRGSRICLGEARYAPLHSLIRTELFRWSGVEVQTAPSEKEKRKKTQNNPVAMQEDEEKRKKKKKKKTRKRKHGNISHAHLLQVAINQ